MKRSKTQTQVSGTFQSFEEFDENILVGVALMNLGIAKKILGDADGAISQFQRARSHFEEGGDLGRLAEVHHLMGMSSLTKQLSPEALNEFEQCSSLSPTGTNQTKRGLAFLGKAHAFYVMGDFKTALWLANRCLDSLSIRHDCMYLADVYKFKAMIHVQRGKTGEAKRAFLKSVQCFKKVGASQQVKRASIELQSMKEKSTNELRRPRKAKI